MCLRNSSMHVAGLVKSNKQVFTGYKQVLYDIKTNKLRSFFKQGFVWQPGENCAKRSLKRICYRNKSLYFGIHVYRGHPSTDYTEMHRVSQFTSLNRDSLSVYIKVTGKLKDLRGASDYQMLFSKVNLSRTEYRNVIKRAKEWLRLNPQ